MRKSFSYLDQTVAFLVLDHRRREFIDVESIGRLEGLKVAVPNDYYLQRLRHAAPNLEGELPQADALLYTTEAGSAWTLMYPAYSVVVPDGLNVKKNWGQIYFPIGRGPPDGKIDLSPILLAIDSQTLSRVDGRPRRFDNRSMNLAADNDRESVRDEYFREGFLRRPGFFADEIVLLASIIDGDKRRLLEHEDVTIDSQGGEASNLGYLGHGDDVITSFAATARLVNLVSELLADQVYLLKGRLNIKWGDDAQAKRGGWDPHQDRAAWAKEGLPGDAALTAAIAIDPSDADNGTLEVIPGSHAGGILEHTAIDAGYGISEEIIGPILERSGRTALEMAAGDMVIFSGDLIHLSKQNLGSRRRALLFLTFNALGNCPPKGVGPSRYQCTGPLRARDDQILADLAREFRAGRYTPELDWDAIAHEREIDIAEDIDSGWTDLTPTLRPS